MIKRVLSLVKRMRKPRNRGQIQHDNRTNLYPSRKVAVPFILTAVSFFFIQSVVATIASLEFVFPRLPVPVPFNIGRSIHLNLSVYWPLFGLMGAAYYFLIRESEVDVYSVRLAKVQFWLLLFTFLGILGSLALGISAGREYLEAIFPFKIATAAGMGLFWYNLWRTSRLKEAKKRFTTQVMLFGFFSALIFYIPNIADYHHIVTDETVRFWVVHLWEELSFELVAAGITAALLIRITGTDRKYIEKLLLIDVILLAAAGIFATGHHYYWNGTPAWWLYIGGAFSALQLGPIILLAVPLIKDIFSGGLAPKHKVTGYFLASSVFWHVAGAGILGFIMAIPQVNRYVHGTLMTSAHSHMALFGVFGIFVLGLAIYILSSSQELSKNTLNRFSLSLWLLNGGVAVMGIALILAGIVHTYLNRVLGLEFMKALSYLKPYMAVRVAGAFCFAAGAVIYSWEFRKLYRGSTSGVTRN